MTKDMLLGHPWFPPFVSALIAVFLALLLHRVASLVLQRVTRHMPVLHALLVNIKGPAQALLPLLALQAVWQAAPDDLRFIASVRHVNGLLLIAMATWVLVRAVNGFADGLIAKHPYDAADNLQARRVLTQTRVLARSANSVLLVAGAAMMLMTFPGARQVGASLLASAGVIGIVAGLAAKPVFSNLIAGLQIALAQPIRMDDALIVNNEFGRVEEITGTYVVLKLWDERRMIVPLQWFIENPFENWTHTSSTILGTVFLWLDFTVPTAAIRAEFERVCQTLPLWDKRVCVMHVTDTSERNMQVRLLVSARDSGSAFDLRCQIREHMIGFIASNYPDALPRLRAEVSPRNQPEALESIIDGAPGEKSS